MAKDLSFYYDSPMESYPWGSRLAYRLFAGLIRLISAVFFRLKVYHIDHLFSLVDQGGCVIIANHMSQYDPAVVVAAAAPRVKPRFLYKSELDKHRLVSWFTSRAGAIPVVRHTADRVAIRRMVDAAKRGECVGIFPEGTRHAVYGGETVPAKIHGGFALIASMANVPILPIGISNTHQIMPGKARFPRPVTLRAKVGTPLNLSDYAHLSKRDAFEAIERDAMAQVYALRDELDAQLGVTGQENLGKEGVCA